MSIEVKSDLPITEQTFDSKFNAFESKEPLKENIVLYHRFACDLNEILVDHGKRIYCRPPWAIYHSHEQWIYQWITAQPPYENYFRTVITDLEHTFLDIYNDKEMEKKFLAGQLTSLTLFPTDQIFLGRLLAYKNGCILHSVGISLNNQGYLFVGHSSAGKSTMATILKKEATILCDDRNIVRKQGDDYILSGTWSHGDVTDVSGRSVPLKAIFFLEKSDINRMAPVLDAQTSFNRLLACLIRPLETRDWWDKSLDFLNLLSQQVPCWNLKFNKTGQVLDLIKGM